MFRPPRHCLEQESFYTSKKAYQYLHYHCFFLLLKIMVSFAAGVDWNGMKFVI